MITRDEMPGQAPGLWRRLACMVYESLLLFGVTMAAGALYSIGTDQRHALLGVTGLQAFLFLVLAIYFVVFWSRSGQTLAMKTWRIRVVGSNGAPPSQPRALLRYLLAWIWLLPPLAVHSVLGVRSLWSMTALALAWAATYASSSRLRLDRQYWHDALAGTRLVLAARHN